MVSWAHSTGGMHRPLVDTHVHVVDPRFPFTANRSYTPGPATAEMLSAHLERVGAERVVVVQASPYGSDNRALLDALETFGPEARGVAVVDDAATSDLVRGYGERNVAGLRLNVPLERLDGDAMVSRFERLAYLAASHGMHVSVHARTDQLARLSPSIAASPATVVIEHFGLLRADLLDTGEASAVLRLLADGDAWIKLCGIYKIATGADWSGARPVIERLAATNPDQLVWGSDWPHTSPGANRSARSVDEVEPFQEVDDLAALHATLDGIPQTLRSQVLSANPTRLFNFA